MGCYGEAGRNFGKMCSCYVQDNTPWQKQRLKSPGPQQRLLGSKIFSLYPKTKHPQ
jgi:hypothetical protein